MDILSDDGAFCLMEHLKMVLLVCIQTSHSFYEVQTVVGSDMMDMCNRMIFFPQCHSWKRRIF